MDVVIAYLFLSMIQVLSIDLDSIWEGMDSIYRDPNKKLNQSMLELVLSLSCIKRDFLRVGLDHHSMCVDLDKFTTSYEIDHVDAHHDLFAENHFTWLNPLFIRAKRVNVGNFLFQLLRERELVFLRWLLPENYAVDVCQQSVIQQIGQYYAQKVEVEYSLTFQFKKHYNFIFISLSPEWIPEMDRDVVEKVLGAFHVPKDQISFHLNGMDKRWACQDDQFLTMADRFYFKEDYKSG